jgi:D-glycero-D-manno-heptose 1,7-bisphosphate phosphatase
VQNKPLILLDRDGTLIEERDYPSDPDGVKLLPGTVAGLRKLKQAGFRLVVVSNQSGIGRGILSVKQVKSVSQRFQHLLRLKKIVLDGVYWCPHSPTARCSCRKPKLGLVKRAAKKLRVSWKGSISVGDRLSDVQLGQNAAGQGVLVLTGYGRAWKKTATTRKPDHIARNFGQAADWILRKVRSEYGR